MENNNNFVNKPEFVNRSELRIDNGQNIAVLATELKRQRETKKDYIVPSQKLRVLPSEEDITLEIDGTGTYNITGHCHNQIAAKLEIPQSYYDKVKQNSPELLATNVNHWLKQEKPKLVRTLDGKARAFMSDRYKIIDNDDVFYMSIDEMQKAEMQFFRADLTEQHLYLKAVSNSLKAEVRKGDIVQAGLVIRNSEIGMSQFQVDPFVLRLVCLNGLIREDSGLHQKHLGKKMIEGVYSRDTQELNALASLSAMRDIVRNTLNGQNFDKTVALLTEATEINIEKPIQAITNISLHEGFNDTEKDNILTAFIKNSDSTKYGLMNAITQTAKSVTAERMIDLESAANDIITIPDETFDEIVNRKLKGKRGDKNVTPLSSYDPNMGRSNAFQTPGLTL